MKRTRKKHNAVIKAKGLWWRRSGGTGRSPSWRVSSAFIRTGSTWNKQPLDGAASVFEGGGGARMLGKRSLEKRCPSDGGPRVRIHLPPAASLGFARSGWSPRRPRVTSGRRSTGRADKVRCPGNSALPRASPACCAIKVDLPMPSHASSRSTTALPRVSVPPI